MRKMSFSEKFTTTEICSVAAGYDDAANSTSGDKVYSVIVVNIIIQETISSGISLPAQM